ncbi:hypothetical protein DEA8626_01787 [Defluviimonas aquaemixtae]|uniref:Uncharacterized protein n=1 Tax=Albidovulum aquaemixtae TaxID=1542388 RepID=A0A2R8B6I8_9RHOB|nr:hypothetical protein [Defluviimonas aquaemixtae]SPH18255.1 hypothetical protein DEA8626_01787 [Defluviimonas aquaemixtae]
MVSQARRSLTSLLCLLVACTAFSLSVIGGPVGASVVSPHAEADPHAHPTANSPGVADSLPDGGAHCDPGPDCGPQALALQVSSGVAGHAGWARLGRVFGIAIRETFLTFEPPPPRRSRI